VRRSVKRGEGGNRDARQASAVLEGLLSDAGDAVRDRDAGQAGAAVEGSIPDAGDRITFNGVRNHQLAGGSLNTIGDGDLASCRGPRQVI